MSLKNPKITFISSMNIKLYEQYGKTFLEEFDKFAGHNIKLLNIFENLDNTNFDTNKIKNINFDDEKHKKFMKYFGNLYEAGGLRITLFNENGQKKINLSNNFRFNAIKFSYKVFAVNYSLNYLSDEDFLIWTDADLRCKKEFNSSDLIQFMPEENQLMSYLGRTEFPPERPYSECGFLGFNVKHSQFKNYLYRMADVYNSGEIFSHEEWHDSWIWDQVRNEFEAKGVKFKNISGEKYQKIEHPFVNCDLGKFFDHLKGNRKNTGVSHKEDFI